MIGLGNARALGSIRMVWIRVVVLVAALLASVPAGAADLGPVQGGALPGPLPLFPPDNWWNVDVSGAPVDGGSAAFIAYINNGGQRRLHPDLGGEVSSGSVQTYGMPYAVVDGTQPRLTVDFVLYANQSDGVGVLFYPIPVEAITEPHWIVTVTLSATTSLTLSPSTVVGGASVSGTVTLSGNAPSAGIVVTLTSSRPSQAAVPRSLTVAAGQRSATFIVTTVPVTTNTTAWISGTYRGATKGATLAIKR